MRIRWEHVGRCVVVLVAVMSCQSGNEGTGAPAASSVGAPVKASALPGPKVADGTVKLGAPITATESVPLSRLMHEVKTFAKHTVKTEGKVTAVCQAMGCWMEIADAETQAHIRMSGHRFFVPKDASGRR